MAQHSPPPPPPKKKIIYIKCAGDLAQKIKSFKDSGREKLLCNLEKIHNHNHFLKVSPLSPLNSYQLENLQFNHLKRALMNLCVHKRFCQKVTKSSHKHIRRGRKPKEWFNKDLGVKKSNAPCQMSSKKTRELRL